MSTNSLDSGRTMVVEDRDTEATPEPNAEVVVKGRNVEVPDHFRIYVAEKLSRLERFDRTIYLFDVELDHERNRRQRKNCQHVEITARGRGPVVRGEACADSFYAALESAAGKLEARLRRSKDRRKIHYGDKTPVSLHEATAQDPLQGASAPEPVAETVETDGLDDHEPGRVVRTKEHPAKPMTVDDALYEMELVGHDFFLFHDKESDKPSVVYRRHAYDYGLIRLA
ncbi:30S ribosomal protein S30P [Mycolicibacterium mageritense DSM 44476 = CIP 104973]|uniref:Ribosome hibernation promoting factor n=2 Tax=Mycolicibacterium mageritense TaxID=53462 RepID=A0ABM7HY21_MYCME|nr:ribosome-associated translation inhibitor RaiA [Mycolicibacterium mageritense]MBN3453013.1 ribosome-associated translation inhibitor RaiA [Mycobacterium sp. DSM 3803]OKH61863.1 30S ribosomal protein S30 [Mycobacterium sp. SWH-M3]MCC9182769.1 ribosome-associated translation inhibitor RaiA [Mycolicibacterium mageritense]TXI61455.1 MAG: ribosome-associated translation inhibitor RaiA [Mycolicibacterium mageritense]BBX35500.1 ribosomal subunit interface protein [Mycolicibacterium mageritense]